MSDKQLPIAAPYLEGLDQYLNMKFPRTCFPKYTIAYIQQSIQDNIIYDNYNKYRQQNSIIKAW